MTGRFLSALKEGDILALLVDQHARAGGMQIEFFGTPASSYTTAALLHLITGAPLCFGYCLGLGDMHFRMIAGAPIQHEPTGNRKADVQAIMERVNHELEQAIRADPQQYLWAHRRWREPDGSQPAQT